MKQYKTLEELIAEVSATGMIETTTEAAIHYQDLIGHSTTETLYNLANGSQNQEFYKVYGIAYGTIAAIKCYMEYSQKQIDLRSDYEEVKARQELTQKKLDDQISLYSKMDALSRSAIDEYTGKLAAAQEEARQQAEMIKEQATEIMKLKARLFDLITANQ